MAHDNVDEFILKHHKSMSTREMGDKLGVSKSTVSRRMAALRADGSIDETDEEQAKRATERARNGVSFAVTMEERARALCELRDVLHDELGTTGGANLARVSAEYRKTLEELTSLNYEMELAERSVELTPYVLARIRKRIRMEYAKGEERDMADGVMDVVLEELDAIGVARSSAIDRIVSKADSVLAAVREDD